MPATTIGARRIEQWLESLRQRLLWRYRWRHTCQAAGVGFLLLAAALWWTWAREHLALVGTTVAFLCLAWLLGARWRERQWNLPAVATWADRQLDGQEGLLTFVAVQQRAKGAPRLLPALVARLLLSVARHEPAKVVPLRCGRPASFLAASLVLALLSWWLAPGPERFKARGPQESAVHASGPENSAHGRDRPHTGSKPADPPNSSDEIGMAGGAGPTDPLLGKGDVVARSDRFASEKQPGDVRNRPEGGSRGSDARQDRLSPGADHPRSGRGKTAEGEQKSADPSRPGDRRFSDQEKRSREEPAQERLADAQAGKGKEAASGGDRGTLPPTPRNEKADSQQRSRPRDKSELEPGSGASGTARAGNGAAVGGLFGPEGEGGVGEAREARERVLITLLGLRYTTAGAASEGPVRGPEPWATGSDPLESTSGGAPMWKTEVPEPYREAMRRIYARGGRQ